MLVPTAEYQAIPVAPGIAIGRVMRVGTSLIEMPEPVIIDPDQIVHEMKRFSDALSVTREQLVAIQTQLREKLNDAEAAIFDAHLLLADDLTLCAEVNRFIKEERYDAESAIYSTIEKFSAAFAAINDEYLKERAVDVRDVGSRIIGNLSKNSSGIDYNEPRIVISSNLTPSETIDLDRDRVLGFAIETGSATSHTALLARSMKLPAVVGVPRELLEKLTVADKIIIDGFNGKVLVNPDSHTEESYRLKRHEAQRFYSELAGEKNLPPVTTDGFMVQLAANLDYGQDYEEVKQAGAVGVGLFRTEFLFMTPEKIPTEDEQFEIYKKMLISADNNPVTIRTIDIGGDKLNTGIIRAVEQNPFLGLRGIRFCLNERPDIFRTQLRALLRAGVYGDLRIMLPMISSTLELIKTREIIDELQNELTAEGTPAVAAPLGVMIETPVAAVIADKFAEYADFFSIGTNDLIQYTMAVDRSNERVANLYRPSHPAIIKLIHNTVEAAKISNIPVSVCGQMAEDVLLTPLLVGLGVHKLSMPVSAIPLQRRTIRSLGRYECEQLAAEAMNCSNAAEVLEISKAMIDKYVPEMRDK